MKTILLLFVICLFSCKKEIAKLEGKVCWKCHVHGWPDAANPNDKPYDKTVCNDPNDGWPRFNDDYGNDLNADCTKQ